MRYLLICHNTDRNTETRTASKNSIYSEKNLYNRAKTEIVLKSNKLILHSSKLYWLSHTKVRNVISFLKVKTNFLSLPQKIFAFQTTSITLLVIYFSFFSVAAIICSWDEDPSNLSCSSAEIQKIFIPIYL